MNKYIVAYRPERIARTDDTGKVWENKVVDAPTASDAVMKALTPEQVERFEFKTHEVQTTIDKHQFLHTGSLDEYVEGSPE